MTQLQELKMLLKNEFVISDGIIIPGNVIHISIILIFVIVILIMKLLKNDFAH